VGVIGLSLFRTFLAWSISRSVKEPVFRCAACNASESAKGKWCETVRYMQRGLLNSWITLPSTLLLQATSLEGNWKLGVITVYAQACQLSEGTYSTRTQHYVFFPLITQCCLRILRLPIHCLYDGWLSRDSIHIAMIISVGHEWPHGIFIRSKLMILTVHMRAMATKTARSCCAMLTAAWFLSEWNLYGVSDFAVDSTREDEASRTVMTRCRHLFFDY
jgi:hypothetical protein